MASIFVIEDESHSEWMGEFPSLAAAWAELERRAAQAWDQPPNVAPCMSWQTCGRSLDVIEYDTAAEPWEELCRIPAYDVDHEGVRWRTDTRSD